MFFKNKFSAFIVFLWISVFVGGIGPLSSLFTSSFLYARVIEQSSLLEGIESSPLLFSNHQPGKVNNLNGSIYELMNRAQSSILIMTFTLSDPQVIEILNRKIQEGVDVQIIIDRDHLNELRPRLHSAIPLGTRLTGEGHFHHKVLVVDHAYVWLGSANFTVEGFVSCKNLAMGYYDPPTAIGLHEEAKTILSLVYPPYYPRTHIEPLACLLGGQLVELYILPHIQPKVPFPVEIKMNNLAKQKLMDLIAEAKQRIRISMNLWTYKEASQALIRAYQRGIEVEVVTGNAQEEAVQLLKRAGIPIRIHKNLHQKWMLVDDEILWNGSANWSINAFFRNDESLIVLYNLIPEQLAEMESIWQDLTN